MSRCGKVFKDRDYLLTVDGLYFCVVGYVHPPERILAYLKYAPRTGLEGGGYRRALPFYTIPHIEETLTYLQRNYSNYIFHDETTGLDFSSVPIQSVKQHLCPEERLGSLLTKNGKDPLEHKTVELASELSKESGVPLRFLGVTGSILLGIHSLKFSDIDLAVYGKENSLKVREALLSLYEAGGRFEKFKGISLKNWCKDKARLYPISVTEAELLYRRIWNRGVYSGSMFSVHPTRLDWEVKEKYGQKTVLQGEIVEAEATIRDAGEAIFMPATYTLEKSYVREGLDVPLREIVSYEGLYGGIFREGEKVLVKGVLENVHGLENGEEYWRVTVGSLKAGGKDYIKPVRY